MSTIAGVLLNPGPQTPFVGATVSAYTAASQPPPPLTDGAGAALPPVGSPVATATSDQNGAYVLTGLTALTPYHLYIQPSVAQGDWEVITVVPPPDVAVVFAPSWLYWVLPDATLTPALCVLYGQAATLAGAPAPGSLVTVWLQHDAVAQGGIVVSAAPLSLYPSPRGTWAVPLYQSASLTPQGLYYVQVGAALWYGPIPEQSSIGVDDWTTLDSTVRLY